MEHVKKKNFRLFTYHYSYMYAFFFVIALVLVLTGVYLLYQGHQIISQENEPQFISTTSEIRPLRQMWGSIDKTVFPDISNPEFVKVNQADKFLKSSDVVYFIRTKKDIYVYPQFILRFHEVVNQMIDNKAVAVTFCILSNTPLAYNRKINNQIDSFQSLGPLMYGNQVMYDRMTNSYWNELTGVSFYGKLKGQRLHQVMVVENTTWQNIKKFSNLKILTPVLPLAIYRQNEGDNDENARVHIGLTSMMQQKPDPSLQSGRFGYGVFIHNQAKFYPADEIEKQGLISDDVAGWHLIIVYDPTLGDVRIFRSYLNHQVFNFTLDGKYLHDMQTNSIWNLTGTAIKGSLRGSRLIIPAYESSFWYSWASFYPQTTFWE